MQLVLAIPARKSSRDIYALPRTFPLIPPNVSINLSKHHHSKQNREKIQLTSINVGTVGLPSLPLNSSPKSPSSSSPAVVLLTMELRRGSIPSASLSCTGVHISLTPLNPLSSCGAIMGLPGVCTSSSIGRGRRGGRENCEAEAGMR